MSADFIVLKSLVHTSNSVEATFDFVERIVRLVAFDNVASTLLLVWTGLNCACIKIRLHRSVNFYHGLVNSACF